MTDPRGRLRRIRQGLSPAEWTRLGGMVAAVVGLHVLGWMMLVAALGGHYQISKTTVFGVGTGALAYTLGMRHAFDADHIAAIDNTTRKLINEGKRPLSVGFFFSLGHSSVVFALAMLLNLGIRSLDSQLRNGNSGLHRVTGIVGTTVSGTFLYLIAALNLIVLAGIAVASGLPFYAILSLPILFAAGMSLFDTIDGCFMNFAYDWAFARPVRKVFYNLTITGLSVFVALFVGTIEFLGLIGSEYNLGGGFWAFMADFDINKAGFVIVGMFVGTWVIALGIWHFGKIEQKWDLAAARADVGD